MQFELIHPVTKGPFGSQHGASCIDLPCSNQGRSFREGEAEPQAEGPQPVSSQGEGPEFAMEMNYTRGSPWKVGDGFAPNGAHALSRLSTAWAVGT